ALCIWMIMWNIKQLKEHLERQGELPEQYTGFLDSVARCIDIFEYHKEEAYEIITSLDSTDTKTGLRCILSRDNIQKEEQEYKMLAVQSHLHAALQNARSMYDILAQLLNALLVLEPIPIHKCYISDVHKSLPSGNVKAELDNILSSHEYRYINGFVNTIKHRNLVQCGQFVDFIENRYSIRVRAFSYAGTNYEQKWAIDVLEHGLTIKNRLIDVGRLLNIECGVTNA
ncbi:hypothetical protein ABRZ58_22710, partial [Vibrio vulnificus]|uniref:hypothetical protein n=1 Tax=Vibrio vulnificus TaxID=672 RepID=UPI0032EBB44A